MPGGYHRDSVQDGGPKLGIDLGGTKTEVVALGVDGRVLFRQRQPTPAGDYAAILSLIRLLVEEAEHEVGAGGTLGIGTPGSANPRTGAMRNSNTQCLNGRPLQHDLERALDRSVALANDANCFALSEAVDGAGAGASVVFGVILGTGVGGGLVRGSKILLGANRVAGEWGHNPMPGPRAAALGAACYCGRIGCVETVLCGPAFERRIGRSALSLSAEAAQGSAAANAVVDAYAELLADALGVVVNLVDPDAIVLGGGISNLHRLDERVQERLPARVFCDEAATPVRRALHGDSSGVRGAAWLGAGATIWAEGST